MPIDIDAATGQVVAATLTSNDVDDGTQVGTLLDQVDGPIASFTADGAYDQDGVYGEIAERHPHGLERVAFSPDPATGAQR